MPTYEYVCSKCDHAFDQFQSIAHEPLEVCPREKCPQKRWGKGRVKRQISAGAGLIFKGNGFYITDYRSENYKEGAKKDTAPAASGTDNKSSGEKASGDKPAPAAKAESKPAAKKDSK